MMKDEFYVVLPSNSSMKYYSTNTTARYITQLPHQIRLEGEWVVAATEIQIPLSFQHVTKSEDERMICVNRKPISNLEANEIDRENITSTVSYIRPGLYKDVAEMIDEINNLACMKDHVTFNLERGGYVTTKTLCSSDSCARFTHQVILSKKLTKILGFERLTDVSSQEVRSVRPANLSNALPSMLLIYTDICEPYIIGDVQARLLRAVSIDYQSYSYGSTKLETFSRPMYMPLLFGSFHTIEIDIRGPQGLPIPFDFGTVTVTLHFKKVVD